MPTTVFATITALFQEKRSQYKATIFHIIIAALNENRLWHLNVLQGVNLALSQSITTKQHTTVK